MSYDVWLEADLGGPESIQIDDNVNHTSNTVQMWREAGCDLSEQHGREARVVIPLLRAAIADISARRDFLQRILKLCERAPLAKLVVSQ
jgi:hypothetical protein